MDMNMIRPVSDLRNNFADISKTVHETEQPVFLTKNGYGAEAEREAEETGERFSSKDVLSAMKAAARGE